MEVELRTVEGTVALVDNISLADACDSVCERICCDLPVLLGADMILRHGGKLNLIRKTEKGINLVEKLCDPYNLVTDLLGSKENVSVILSEATDTEKTVERTGKLVSVYLAKLAVAKRHFLV